MSDPVVVRQVGVQRMPGINPPGFTVEDLVSGVNVIHGSNGSGKTTTAKAIEMLLSGGDDLPEQALVGGRFTLAGDEYEIHVAAGRGNCVRGNQTVTMPELGPRENRNRYSLALHDLVDPANSNRDFARAVLSASHGGMDVPGAAERCGFKPAPSQTRSVRKAVIEAQDACRTAREKYRALQDQEIRLQALKDQMLEIDDRRQRLPLLEAVLKLLDARKEVRDRETELAQYPSGIEKLTGDERERLEDCENKQREFAAAIDEESRKITQAEDALKAAGLPECGISEEQIRSWRRRCDEFRTAEREIADQQKELAACRAKMERARLSISPDISDEQLAALTPARRDELADFAAALEQLRSNRAALDHRLKVLGEPNHPGDERQVREAARTLRAWLSSPPPEARKDPSRGPVIAAMVVIVLLAVMLAVLSHVAWLLAGGLALLPWWLMSRGLSATPVLPDRRAQCEQEFACLGITPPKEWTEANVQTLLDRLEEACAEACLEAERESERRSLRIEDEKLDGRIQALRASTDRIRTELGIPAAWDDLWLHPIVNAIARWQEAAADAAAALARLEESRERSRELCRQLHDELSVYDGGSAGDAEAMHLRIEELDRRGRVHTQALQNKTAASAARDTARRQLEDLNRRYQDLFTRASLTPGDRATLLDWLDQKASFDRLKSNLYAARAAEENARRPLADHPDLLDCSEQSRPTIENERADIQACLATRDDLVKQITGIERDISAAKEDFELTDALKKYDDALADLRQKRAEEGEALVGDVLAEFIAGKAAEHRPDVFNRARELLGGITAQRLRLEFDEREGGSFRVIDNGLSGIAGEKTLDQLSSGERLQVLIAVRLAFLEQQEQELSGRLPLLIDEALANSDDYRAGAIIDAVIEAARTGRQVFYFTAQLDEVAKWKERLQDAGVASRIVDLDEARDLARMPARPVPQYTDVPRTVPAPDGMTREEYARVLHVPAIDPWLPDARRVHLWHLIDDLEALHRLLVTHHETWGQLKDLADHGGMNSPADRALLARTAARAKAIEACLTAWQTGRARIIDKSHLSASGAVSETMMERVAGVLERVHGDAGSLVRELRDNPPPAWRQAKTEQLAQYLLDNGYISPEEPLTREAANSYVTGVVWSDLQDGLVDQIFIDAVLHLFFDQPTLPE